MNLFGVSTNLCSFQPRFFHLLHHTLSTQGKHEFVIDRLWEYQMIQIGWSEDLDFGDFKVTVNILIFRIRQDVRVTQFEVDKKSTPAVIQFLTTFELIEPLNPRHGGVRLQSEAHEGEEILRYVDINSLYPQVNKNKTYPVAFLFLNDLIPCLTNMICFLTGCLIDF